MYDVAFGGNLSPCEAIEPCIFKSAGLSIMLAAAFDQVRTVLTAVLIHSFHYMINLPTFIFICRLPICDVSSSALHFALYA